MGTSGPAEQSDASAKGIIPRAAAHLFQSLEGGSTAHSRTNSGLKSPTRYSLSSTNLGQQFRAYNDDKNWQMFVTYVEIYNEQPRDLLLPEGSSVNERSAVQIREDAKGRIFVEGLRSVPVNTVEELMGVLNHGSAIRQTDATAINSRSSRSHAVFTVNLRQVKHSIVSSPTKSKQIPAQSETGTGPENTITIDSKLHFVDLAGSERLKNTGATGDRAREGISINAGLASLGKVISQLSSRSAGSHVSYRDSKLTRMLQDSLGGNAITYMVACVTPAEFHLSETLNTVQYAQRARNIQSKPQIQRVNEDSDKQATIERLRSEVAFLRQQIRSADTGERKFDTARERNAADVEMQNQLLDVQEGYRNLSERHAKLVAELTMSPDQPQDTTTESAAERLKRSQEHQKQIENMILEYETTIQSLEANISTTKSSLASTESALLEKETKCAYIETMNQQLNSRIQKLMEREANTESYMHELEARLEDSTSGGEKYDAVVSELRREMARVRESEVNSEEYISTLEERLAEADQDMETMQREIERLEQLVERQRSLGKLDNLLYELDQVQRKHPHTEQASLETGSAPKGLSIIESHVKQGEPMDVIQEAKETETAQYEAEELKTPQTDLSTLQTSSESSRPLAGAKSWYTEVTQPDEEEPNPAQAQFMQDKFETVSQELFDLRLEHETTVSDYDLLSAKYHEALRTLAEMQDRFDDVQSSPTHSIGNTMSEELDSTRLSFLGEKVPELARGAGYLSSRSPSSELSLVGESAISMEPTESIHTAKESQTPDSSREEIERLHELLAEHERNMNEMKNKYLQLHDQHKGTLDTVEKLRLEAQRSRSPMPHSHGHGMIRRPTSQLGSTVDRGQRSIASLRGLITEELEDKPDRVDTAELHLSAATHELQSRLNRIQSLEVELQNVKKEMDMKSTIISGLTRERNSLKSGTPVDLSMVSQMRDQLIQKETELKTLHEGYGKREQELQAEVVAARKELEETNASHDKAKQNLEEHEVRVKTSSAELEAAMSTIETLKSQQSATTDKSAGSTDDAVVRATTANADNYQGVIDKLKADLEQQISTNLSHGQKISELTQMHEDASKDIHEHSQIIQAKSGEIEQHKRTVKVLQSKLQETESAVEFHKHGLKTLHEAHANELEEMKLSHAGFAATYDDRITELNIKHGEAIEATEAELESARTVLQQILESAKSALGHDTSEDMLVNHIQDLAEEKKHITEANKRLISTNAELEAQLTARQSLQELEEAQEAARFKIANYQETIKILANEIGNHEDTIREKETLVKKHVDTIQLLQVENQKKVMLIEELEQQLQSSYEQHEKRVSVMQQQGSHALTEAQHRISQLEKDLQRSSISDVDNDSKKSIRPQSPVDLAGRSNSITSNLRKSASIASLPSPPPAIPLPPLPTLPTISAAPAGNPSPPSSRHTSKELTQSASPTVTKDMQLIKRQSAIIDDQDSRLRTMEKHLHAEKQLTATLEEALVDLETQSNKLRVDAESWKKKAWALEEEVTQVRSERRTERLSVQAVEEEVKKRRAAEDARAQLEERMKLLKQSMDGTKKKKKMALNCF